MLVCAWLPCAAGAQTTVAGPVDVTAATTGYAVVRVEQPVTVDGRFRGAIEIEGRGRLSGVMIRPDTDDPGRTPLFIAAISEPEAICFDACSLGPGFMSVQSHEGKVGDFVIKPGDYRIYVIADGAPVTVRLGFPGAEAPRAISATQPVAAHFAAPEPRPFDAAGVSLGAGATLTLPSTGVLFNALGYESNAQAASRLQTCTYARPPQNPDAYGPECPESDGMHEIPSGPAPLGTAQAMWEMTAPVPPGSYGLGGNVTLAGRFEHLASRSVGVAFAAQRPPAPPAQPAQPAPRPGPAALAPPVASSSTARVAIRAARWHKRRVRGVIACESASPCRGVLRLSGARPTRFRIPAGETRRLLLRPARRICRRITLSAVLDGAPKASTVRRTIEGVPRSRC